MRFLLDMGISPLVGTFLASLGHEAQHLSQLGEFRLSDEQILLKAREEVAVVVTHDLDFAYLVATGGERLPSVVIFRLQDMRPARVCHSLELVLSSSLDALAAGAVVSVSETAIRIRALPLGA